MHACRSPRATPPSNTPRRAAAATARRYGVPPGLSPSRATVLDDIDRLEGTGPPRGRGMDRERLTQAAIATKIIPAAGGAPPKNAVVKSPAPDVQARDIGVGRASSPDIRPLRSGLPRGRELEGAVPVEPAAVPCRAPVLLAHESPIGFVAGEHCEGTAGFSRRGVRSEPAALAQPLGQVDQVGDLLVVAPPPDLGCPGIDAGRGAAHLGNRRGMSVEANHSAGLRREECLRAVAGQDRGVVASLEEGPVLLIEDVGLQHFAEQVALGGHDVEQGPFGDLGVCGDCRVDVAAYPCTRNRSRARAITRDLVASAFSARLVRRVILRSL